MLVGMCFQPIETIFDTAYIFLYGFYARTLTRNNTQQNRHGGGKFAPPVPLSPTTEQRKQAVEALGAACATLQEHGVTRSHIEMLLRVGSPANELASLAGQQQVDCLVIGSRGHSPLQ